MNVKKPLTQCYNEAERRENYPLLCRIADMIENTSDPGKVLQAVVWILKQRRNEAKTATEGTEGN